MRKLMSILVIAFVCGTMSAMPRHDDNRGHERHRYETGSSRGNNHRHDGYSDRHDRNNRPDRYNGHSNHQGHYDRHGCHRPIVGYHNRYDRYPSHSVVVRYNNRPYYYADGYYYRPVKSYYERIRPFRGMIVPQLPVYRRIRWNNELVYIFDNVLYRAIRDARGLRYTVIGFY